MTTKNKKHEPRLESSEIGWRVSNGVCSGYAASITGAYEAFQAALAEYEAAGGKRS